MDGISPASSAAKKEDSMKNTILGVVLVLALFFAIGSVVYYNIQDYEYSLDLENDLPISKVYVTLSPEYQLGNLFGNIINNSAEIKPTIQSISLVLGEMNFENKGTLSRVIEIPRLVACIDLSLTPAYNSASRISTGAPSTYAVWPIYSTNEPIFDNMNIPQVYSDPITSEIYPQYNYAQNSNQPRVEIKKGEKVTYYIYLKNAYLTLEGKDSTVLKNAKIEVYDVPIKQYNPLTEGITYESLIYNPTCDSLSNGFDPVKTISIA